MSAERERLERELSDARAAFASARSRWEYHDTEANNARSDMEVARILGVIREEAIRALRADP